MSGRQSLPLCELRADRRLGVRVRAVTAYRVAVIPAEYLEAALCAWPYQAESVAPPADQGANSTTWLVVTTDGRYVAKLVDDLDARG